MNFELITYTVSETMGPPQTLIIHSDGLVRYEMFSNIASLGVSEVGRYEGTLSDSALELLSESVSRSAFEGLPDHWGRIPVGSRLRRVRVEHEGFVIEKAVADSEPVDPTLKSFLDNLDTIANSSRANPLRTLKLDVQDARMINQETLEVRFVLGATGTEEVNVPNPTVGKGADAFSIEARPVYHNSLLLPFSIKGSTASISTEFNHQLALIQIDPKDHLSFVMRMILPNSVGPDPLNTFSVSLVYRNSGDSGPISDAFGGEIVASVR